MKNSKMLALKQFQKELKNLPDTSNERSYYTSFQNFLKSFFQNECQEEITTVAEESTQGEIGFPDITLRINKKILGWIEVKLPVDDLENKNFREQFDKYKDGLENIIFTNFRQWQLWQWDKDGKTHKIAEITCNIYNYTFESEQELKRFFSKFLQGHAYDVRTPKQLALALAKKTKLLSQQVKEDLQKGQESEFFELKETFSQTLIQDISTHQFSNMVAETLAYSLFLAILEYTAKNTADSFTLTTAVDFLPKNVPILRDLYDLVKRVSKNNQAVQFATQHLLEQLGNAHLGNIRTQLLKVMKDKRSDNAVLYFYEPFLKAYDPSERKARGVYYTPKPVVDFIVRSVDYLLEKKFNKKGLADESVHILDPATGTGSFLLSAIQQVYQRIKKENEPLGESMVANHFKEIVLKHILKHFYGFELLVAPYAMAHLNLTLELKKLGFDFQTTYDDGDPDNDRFQIFLANALDDPKTEFVNVPAFNAIPKESESARQIKNDKPILAIIGNPPYANFGMMNKQKWILALLESYKKGLKEKKNNLQDDYIKFIRFAQWKINQTEQGIFAMITANSFLDGITHRQMRESLLETFDEIYIYNLHGSSRKGETCPDGSKDENVFDIQTGVSINIFVKTTKKQQYCKVYYADAWGKRKEKEKLLEQKFAKLQWQQINYKGFNKTFLSTKWSKVLGKLNFFVPSSGDITEKILEYGNFWSIQEVFAHSGSGVKTERDNITIHFSLESLKQVLNDFIALPEEKLREKYDLQKDSRDWKIDNAKKDVQFYKASENKIFDISYRPFDTRKIWYNGKKGFVGTPGFATMQHMLGSNFGMVARRTAENTDSWYQMFVTSTLMDINFLSAQTYIFPLYLYTKTDDYDAYKIERKANISHEFMEEFSQKLDLTPSPEEIFYYAYAIFHCPTYRTRYAEQLKIDFPRLPLTADKKLFQNLVQKGNELVNLHLLGENPFDESATIFDNTNKWQVQIGGKKPQNCKDWEIEKVTYDSNKKRVYINIEQYFTGIEKETWEFMVGGYQVLEKWLKDRKKANRCLSIDEQMHYLKIIVSLRETHRLMVEIDKLIPSFPIK